MDIQGYQYNLGLKFYAIVANHSSRIALKYPDTSEHYDYDELNALSNRIGRYLLHIGIKKGQVIAIFNEKSPYAYSLILACIKIGAIYTNLDITSPWARLNKILSTCDPSAIFIDRLNNDLEADIQASYPRIKLNNLSNSLFQEQINKFDKENLGISNNVHGGDPAYIMFTSGSTGFPKGAVMSHNNVLNFIKWSKQTFSISPEDIFTNANPIYFDNSVFDFYSSIFNGATLVPLSHDLVKDARELVKAINGTGCTIWFSVPSLLVYLLTTKALGKGDFPNITRISFGGEGFPKNKLKQLFTLFSDRATLYNVYGPTECTCICSSYIINETDFENMSELAPLGYIAPNFGYEILPLEDNRPHFGELALVGPCVGLGYYNDTDRTSKSFVQNPHSQFHQLMCKTGDVVEEAENGYLHFRGRVDNQIKHMGYRIELEEIEAAFNTLNYINEVGVIYEKVSAELGQIKAYVSISESNRDSSMIVSDIKNLLPPYMIPRTVTVLHILPKNANGKIDRKQLANM